MKPELLKQVALNLFASKLSIAKLGVITSLLCVYTYIYTNI